MALPNILDPMYWLGDGGMFASAVLPGILVIVFIETGCCSRCCRVIRCCSPAGFWRRRNPPVNIWVLVVTVSAVAVLGDQCAYFIGRRIGPALFDKEDS